MEQDVEIYSSFPIVQKYCNPDVIVELGTGTGEFTLYMDFLFKVPILTIDRDDRRSPETKGKWKTSLEFYQNSFEHSLNKIQNHIDNKNVVLWLIDGGNGKNRKWVQLQLIKPYIKKGDIIMTHDYPIPNNGGCTEHEFSDYMAEIKAIPYFYDIMKSACWGSCIIVA
jgi:predicted O-methyltransferase YrrM